MIIKFNPSLFDDKEPKTDEEMHKWFLCALETLVNANRRDILAGRTVDQRAKSSDLLDDDNLVAWQCAELRERGIKAKPYLTWKKLPDGGTVYRVKIQMPDGTVK